MAAALRRHPRRRPRPDVLPGVPRPGGRRDADPADAEHYVGLLSLFGVYEASRDDGTSAADGQRRQLDVTAQVGAQAATFRPLAAPVRLRGDQPGPRPGRRSGCRSDG